MDEGAGILSIQIIPPLLQLYPDIELQHAEETTSMSLISNKWTWLFAGRVVYLVGPVKNSPCSRDDDNEFSGMRIFHAGRSISALIAAYIADTQA